jgi:hypothetical protein
MIARVLALLLSVSAVVCASQSPAPKPSDAAKRDAPKPATSGNLTGKTAQSTTPPITVVVQEPPKDPAAQARQDEREERSVRAAEHMVTLTTCLIVATVFTLTFIGWQAWETRREANATVQQVIAATSARLFIDGVHAANFESGQEPVFFLRVGNTGAVPAEDVRVSIEIDHLHGGVKQIADWNSMLIPANNHRDYPLRASFILPEIRELETWGLKITGTVTHRDNTIPYCFKYHHWQGPRPDGLPLFVPCDFDFRLAVTAKITGVAAIGVTGHVSATLTNATDVDENKKQE